VGTVIRYSEAFKRQVIDQIAAGKFSSPHRAQKAYGIRGSGTVESWVRKYGREDLLPKRVRIESMKEVREIVSIGLRRRDKNQIGLKWPLSKATIKMKGSISKNLHELIMSQLNVKELEF